jgi:hypothetical protein
VHKICSLVTLPIDPLCSLCLAPPLARTVAAAAAQSTMAWEVSKTEKTCNENH